MKKLVHGVGINDAGYTVQPSSGGKQTVCPFYRVWASMLLRSYSTKFHNRNPTYIGCGVESDWLIFSNFKNWMETQEWEGKQLDKDLLFPGNKVYDRVGCVFIPKRVNTFMTERKHSPGSFPVGVYWSSHAGRFKADIRDLSSKKKHLGYYDCPQEAHKAWLTEKRKLARILANEQCDLRIAEALIKRYENYETGY